MTDEFVSADDPELQQLVAYLDGELDDSTTERVEQRLAEDCEYRQRLQQLQRAWDMLDYLPRAEANEGFTKTTIEMVAEKATSGRPRRAAWSKRWNLTFWGAAAMVAVVAAAVGYLATSRVLSTPDRQLVRDLPVIENVELYSHVDDIDFLRALDESGLFDVEDELVEEFQGAT